MMNKDAAGPTSLIQCKKCKKITIIYTRSLFGVGKICPGCGAKLIPSHKNFWWVK